MQRYTALQAIDLSASVALAVAKAKLPQHNLTRTDRNWFITNFQSSVSYVGQAYTLTFGQLCESLEHEEFNQFDVDPKRVSAILKNADGTGLLSNMTLYRDIEVGYTRAEYEQLGEEARPLITGGRHRLTALITLFELCATPIPYEVYSQLHIRVNAKVYSNTADLMRAVFVDNSSRSMGSGEKANVRIQLSPSAPADPKDWEELMGCSASASTSSDAKRFFALAFMNRALGDGNDLRKQTLFVIGNSIANELWKTPFKGQNSKSSHLDTELVARYLQLATEVYALHFPTDHDNVAREATNIGKATAAELIEELYTPEPVEPKVVANIPKAQEPEEFIKPKEAAPKQVKAVAAAKPSLSVVAKTRKKL